MTPNDTGDVDMPAPTDSRTIPMITSVVPGASTTHITGLLNSTASTTFDVDLFSDPACPGRRTICRARLFSGPGVTTDGSGNAASRPTFRSSSLRKTSSPPRPPTRSGTHPSSRSGSFSGIRPPAPRLEGRWSRSPECSSIPEPPSRWEASPPPPSTSRRRRRSQRACPPGRRAPSTRHRPDPSGSDRNSAQRLGRRLRGRAARNQFYEFVIAARGRTASRAGVRRRPLRSRPVDAARADGRLPAQGEARRLLRPAALHRHLRRRPLPLAPSPTGSRPSPPKASRAAAEAATTAPAIPSAGTRWRSSF